MNLEEEEEMSFDEGPDKLEVNMENTTSQLKNHDRDDEISQMNETINKDQR